MPPPSILDSPTSDLHSVHTHMSEEEFLAWANPEVRAEWVDGEVIPMSPASFRHVEINYWLARFMGVYVEHRNLGKVLGQEFAVRLQSGRISRRVPDILFISQARLAQITTNHLEGPPDLAVEIVSPESASRDWRVKFHEYEAAGVGEYWIVDPLNHVFEASVRNAEGKFELIPITEDGILRSTVVPGLWLKPEWLWQDELPSTLHCLKQLGITIS